MKDFIFLVFLTFYLSGFAQTVSTVADGLYYDGLAVDNNGMVYGSNFIGDQVYKYDPTSEVVSLFVDGLTTPNGIAIGEDGAVYVCEASANRISVFDSSGAPITQYTGINNPTGIKYLEASDEFLWV